MAAHDIATQIAEIERELDLRRIVYPGLVADKALSQEQADLYIARLESVLRTLVWIARNDHLIRRVASGG